jgi:hypothetical protein
MAVKRAGKFLMTRCFKQCELIRMGRPLTCRKQWPHNPKAWCSHCRNKAKKQKANEKPAKPRKRVREGLTEPLGGLD